MRLPDITLPGALALITILVSVQNSEGATGINKYVYGGRNAKQGQFPWQAEIWFPSTPGFYSACGGVIIGATWILTNAHCIKGPLPVKVYVGGIDYRRPDHGYFVKYISSYSKHEYAVPLGGYYPTENPRNDIAIIQLAVPLTFSANVKPVRLPRRSQPPLPGGTIVVVSGTGGNTETEGIRNQPGHSATRLRFVQLKLREDSDCTSGLLLCSKKYHNRGAYNGDSGTPWIWRDPSGVDRLVGISSTGRGAARGSGRGRDSRAVMIQGYLDWISRKTGLYIED